MGYSKENFYRTLATAVRDYGYTRDGNSVTITHPDKKHVLLLNVEPLPDRVMGGFRIERVEVSFKFKDFSAEDRDKFMVGFDRSFQRGAG